jgi:glycosyltransferase involved in cell wall biosynthesis
VDAERAQRRHRIVGVAAIAEGEEVDLVVRDEGLELEPGRDYAAGESPAELAAAAGRVLSLPDRSRALAAAARERARAIYSLDAVADRLRPVLAGLVAPEGGPR